MTTFAELEAECDDIPYRTFAGGFNYGLKEWPTEYIEELLPAMWHVNSFGSPTPVYWPPPPDYTPTEIDLGVEGVYQLLADLDSMRWHPTTMEGIQRFENGTKDGVLKRVKLWIGYYPAEFDDEDPVRAYMGTAAENTQTYYFQRGLPHCNEKVIDWAWYEKEYMTKDVDAVDAWRGGVETIVASGEAAQSHAGGGGHHTRPTPGGSGMQMAGAGVGLPGTAGHPSNFGGPLIHTTAGAGSRGGPSGRGGALGPGSTSAPVNTEPFAQALTTDVMLHPHGLDLMQRTADEVLEAWDQLGLDSDPWQLGGVIGRAIRGKLITKGYTTGQVDWFMEQGKLALVDPETDVVANTIGSDNNRVHDTPANRQAVPELPDQRINIPKEGAPSAPSPTNIVVRAPYGYMRPDTSELADMRPQLTQYYPKLVDSGGPIPLIQRSIETFYFPYIPQNVQYQGLGSEWQEIPRAADLPIVEWSKWHLLKATMEFLIAEKADGIYQSVHEEIETLRRMAQRPYPVSVYGMDQLLRISMRRAAETGKALEFVIADLSLSSLRRTMHAGDKEVTAAQVKITLQEIPIEEIRLAEFPTPGFGNDPGPATPDATGDCLDPLTKYTTAPTQTSAGTGGISPYAPEWSASDGCDGDNRDPRYQHVR